MDFSTYKELALSREGKILTLTFNRPDQLNPIDAAVSDELLRFFSEINFDRETNVVILTGAGRAFSAGGDIADMQHSIADPNRMYEGMIGAKKLVFAILDCQKPVIAKLNGHAVGLGATLALFSDVIFAAPHAKIADPHVQVGFVAGDGGAVIWPHLVGYARAKEYLLTGDAVPADVAERIGLINHVVPADELDGRVRAFAQRIANGPSKAIQWTKATINVGLRQTAAAVMEVGTTYESLSNLTNDHREAVNAFLEKRAPVFTGD